MGVVKAAARPAAVPISTQSRWPASECDGPAQPRGSRSPKALVMDLPQQRQHFGKATNLCVPRVLRLYSVQRQLAWTIDNKQDRYGRVAYRGMRWIRSPA